MTQPETDDGQRAALPVTPELDKVRQAREVGRSEEIGGFLEWLEQEGYWSSQPSTERLLADYFKIDLGKVEQERRALLEHVRKANGIS